MGHTWPLFILFLSFQTSVPTNVCEKCPSTIGCYDQTHNLQNMSLPPLPLDQGSRPHFYPSPIYLSNYTFLFHEKAVPASDGSKVLPICARWCLDRVNERSYQLDPQNLWLQVDERWTMVMEPFCWLLFAHKFFIGSSFLASATKRVFDQKDIWHFIFLLIKSSTCSF